MDKLSSIPIFVGQCIFHLCLWQAVSCLYGDVEHEKGAAPGGSYERESNAGTEDSRVNQGAETEASEAVVCVLSNVLAWTSLLLLTHLPRHLGAILERS